MDTKRPAKMSVKKLLGLDNTTLTDTEIIQKILNAEDHDIDEVDFQREDGTIVRVKVPHLKYDPFMYQQCS